jgi:hypothetical protein
VNGEELIRGGRYVTRRLPSNLLSLAIAQFIDGWDENINIERLGLNPKIIDVHGPTIAERSSSISQLLSTRNGFLIYFRYVDVFDVPR